MFFDNGGEMDEQEDEVLSVLVEIRDILNRIYTCFEDQYLEIQKKKYSEKISTFESMLTDIRKKIFPLLIDKNNYTQREIAKIVGISQPAVSQFINLLIKNELIEQSVEGDKTIYCDKYDLLKLV
jgi:predicted XRE-type DNA-binding protein